MPISVHKSTIHVGLEHECAKPFQLFVFWNIIVTNVIAKGNIKEDFRCTIQQFMRVLNMSEGVLLKCIGAVTISRSYSGTICIYQFKLYLWPILSQIIRLFHNSDTYSTYSWGKIICIWAIGLVIHMFINEKYLKLHEEKVHVFSEFDCSDCDKQLRTEITSSCNRRRNMCDMNVTVLNVTNG